ncbi:hypothetical protein C0Q70_00258, partial [Pomacea canaliculata]
DVINKPPVIPPAPKPDIVLIALFGSGCVNLFDARHDGDRLCARLIFVYVTVRGLFSRFIVSTSSQVRSAFAPANGNGLTYQQRIQSAEAELSGDAREEGQPQGRPLYTSDIPQPRNRQLGIMMSSDAAE